MLDVTKGLQAGQLAAAITALNATKANVATIIADGFPIASIVVTIDQGNGVFSTVNFSSELSVADSATLLNDFNAVVQNQINALTAQLQAIS